MGPILGLWRDTWWLWCVFMIAIATISYWVTPFFIVMFPIFFVMFLYFGFVRYDAQGRHREDR